VKRISGIVLVLLLLMGCTSKTKDKGTELTQDNRETVFLSEHKVDPYWFQVENVKDSYVILWSPLNTETQQLRVFNVGKDPITCDLYLVPDTGNPIQSCEIAPEQSGVFENLTSEQCYYVGMKPEGSEVDIIIQD